MKKLFTLDDILIGVFAAIGYGLGYNITFYYTKNIILSLIMCMLLGSIIDTYARKFIYSKKIQANRKNKIHIIILTIVAYFLIAIYMYYAFGSDFSNDVTFQLLYTIGVPICAYIFSFFVVSIKVLRLKQKYKDGSGGYSFDKEAIEYIKKLNGDNKEIKGEYDKNLAVKTKTGIYVGTLENDVLIFKGIPYAENLIKTGRWKLAKKLSPSEKVYEAKYYGNSPIQENFSQNIMKYHKQSEDCLFLNVWTKNINVKNKPVIVHIYTSESMYYASSATSPLCDPYQFVKNNDDMVYFNFNFRQTIFGSPDLSNLTNDEEYKNSNNLAIYDIITALRWIKENVSAFGGDENNITIIGNNVGGSYIQLLYLMKETEELFNKVVIVSGSIIKAFTINVNDNKQSIDAIIKDLNIKNFEELLNVDARVLSNAQEKYIYKANGLIYDVNKFGVDISELFKVKKKNKVDFIFVITGNEMSNYFATNGKEDMIELINEIYSDMEGNFNDFDKRIINKLNDKFSKSKMDKEQIKVRILEYLINISYILNVCNQLLDADSNVYVAYWDIASEIEKFKANTTSFLISLFENDEVGEMYGYINPKDISMILQKLIIKFMNNKNLELYNNEIQGVNEIKWDKYNKNKMNLLSFSKDSVKMENFISKWEDLI